MRTALIFAWLLCGVLAYGLHVAAHEQFYQPINQTPMTRATDWLVHGLVFITGPGGLLIAAGISYITMPPKRFVWWPQSRETAAVRWKRDWPEAS